MSNDSARLLAAITRLNYQKARVARLAAQRHVAPAAPGVEGIIDEDDGTLNKDVIGTDLNVEIPEWENLPEPGFGDFDVMQLEIARVDDTGNPTEFVAVGSSHQCDKDTKFPLVVPLSKDDYPENGKRHLRYRIEKYNGNPDEVSDAIALIFDKTPPYAPNMPGLAIPDTQLLTDAFFATSPSGLKVTLPAYDDQDAKDVYALYYSDTIPSWPEVPDPVAAGLVPANRELLINKADIERLNDGLFYITYIVLDKATNRSQIALPVEVKANLGALPMNLKEPVVPLAAGDGLIDLADARMGVTAEIQPFDNFKPTDFIEVTWGTSEPITEQIGSRTFPIAIPIPHDRLRAAYGGADDKVETTVSYRILRHGVPYGPKSTDVDVDFSVAGPDPDPTWPGPVNPKLDAPVVKGAVSDKENVLERSDAGQPATLTFQLYTNAKDGELVDFYWRGTLVSGATYTVDTAGGPDIDIEIPWSYILEAGNDPALPVHYTIRKPTGAGNEQSSPSALVNANAVEIVPDAAELKRLSNNGWLNCNSLWEDPSNPAGEPAFKVFVKSLKQYLPTGGEVTMTWTALGGRSGENTIPGAGKTETLTITQAQAEDGFHWEVKPYVAHILPIYDPNGFGQDGRGRVNYSLEFMGETVTSKTAEAVVSLGTGSGTCAIL